MPRFRNGIHPNDLKAATKNKPIQTVFPEKGTLMVYPMLQHIGSACEPVVSVGDRVLRGQKIGESRSFVSSPIHSSVSGTVKSISPGLTPSGIKTTCVTIINDGLMLENKDYIIPNDDYELFSKEMYLKIIREAGIVGLGGAGFPTHIKLDPPDNKIIDYIIVNGAECEPILTLDYRLLLEETDKIISGLNIVLNMFPEARGIIAIESNKMDAVKRIRTLCKDDKRIKVIAVETKYPQGAEKQLIYSCTGRIVPTGALPADIGVIVDNVDTILAVWRAVVQGRPLMRRVITVAGGAVCNKGNFKVQLGMSYFDLIEQTGGFKERPYKIISGGPMMGVAVYDLDVPIIKTSSAIICFTKRESELPDETGCIRCARCVEHCPMNLMPLELNRFALKDNMKMFEKRDGLSCIECGACSYICPSKRHLTQSIRSAKRTILDARKKK